jgi:hypothetical protein
MNFRILLEDIIKDTIRQYQEMGEDYENDHDLEVDLIREMMEKYLGGGEYQSN